MPCRRFGRPADPLGVFPTRPELFNSRALFIFKRADWKKDCYDKCKRPSIPP